MAHLLRELEIDEVSFCKEGANPGAKVALFKSMEQENMAELDDVKKELETTKGSNEALKVKIAELEKTIQEKEKAPITPAEAVAKKMEELDPEIKANIAKMQKDQETAKADLAKAQEAITKMEMAALEKEIKARLEKCPRATAGEKIEELVTKFAKLDTEAREVIFKSFEKAETVAGTAESMFKEKGKTGAESGSAYAEICKKVDELRKSSAENAKLSDAQLRVVVRKANPELATRERDEASA